MAELPDLGVRELLEAFRRKEASPRDALISHLGRIDRLDPQVGAVLTLCWESALRDAEESTRRWASGTARRLEGIPYGLKDIIETKGVRTTGGSLLYEAYVPHTDAAVAERLSASGAVMVAKLQTFEFAAGANVVTSNPWDLSRTAAGSSSGSAAAVAARELPLTIGTDTGGSVAIPASFCGITGLKATFGRIPRHGVFPLCWTLDHVGPMTRSAEDAAIALKTIAGRDDRDPSSAAAPVDDYPAMIERDVSMLRIGVPSDWFFDVVNPAVAQAAREAVAVFEHAGSKVIEFPLPSSKQLDLHAMELTIINAEAASLHTPHMAKYDKLGPEFQQILARSQAVSAADYLTALRGRHLVQRDFEAAFEAVDVVIVPGAITTAPRHDHLVADLGDFDRPWVDVVSRTTAIFNLTGIPSVSIPSGFSEGLPIGIQIAGRPYDEATVLAAAHAYQQMTDFHKQVPGLVSDDTAARHESWNSEHRTVIDEAPIRTETLDSTW